MGRGYNYLQGAQQETDTKTIGGTYSDDPVNYDQAYGIEVSRDSTDDLVAGIGQLAVTEQSGAFHDGQVVCREVRLTSKATNEVLRDYCHTLNGLPFSVDDFRDYLQSRGKLLDTIADDTILNHVEDRAQAIADALSVEYGARFVSIRHGDSITFCEVVTQKSEPSSSEAVEVQTEGTEARSDTLQDDEHPEISDQTEETAAEPVVIETAEPDESLSDDTESQLTEVQEEKVTPFAVENEESHTRQPEENTEEPELTDEQQSIAPARPKKMRTAQHAATKERAARQMRVVSLDTNGESRAAEARVVYLEKVLNACRGIINEHDGIARASEIIVTIRERQPKKARLRIEVLGRMIDHFVGNRQLFSNGARDPKITHDFETAVRNGWVNRDDIVNQSEPEADEEAS